MSKGVKITILALTVAVGFTLVASQSFAGDAAKDEKVFKANCVVCHGDKGDGKGAAAAALTPKPKNFTDANEMKGIDDARIHKSLMEGRPGTAMVGFAKTLSADDIENVIAYLKTLGGFGKAK